ncbi:MAG: tyrosine-protein phosphatase [Clostridia bacterium]|nr:tyrosine-protein phosphatase [Clostridia bacterium]
MIQNLRDLGGLKTAEGKTIKPNCLIRSAHLYQATEGELAGVSTVIDLRTPGERNQAPDQTWQREYLPLPVCTDEQAGISHERDVSEQLLPDFTYLYERLIDECADSFRTIVMQIMGHDFTKGAVLWHCTEGKDRCGLTTALILESLGVERDAIMEDYLKTNIVNLPKAIRIRERLMTTHGKEMAEEAYQAYIADERYLKAAWSAMGADYISKKLKIDEETVERFRAAVLH